MLMFPLHNLVLLWSGNIAMLMYDAIKLKEINHLKFKPIVQPFKIQAHYQS